MNPSIDAAHQEPVRRPLKSRNTRLAAAFAGWLTGLGLTPNQISVASVFAAGAAAASFAAFGFAAEPGGLLLIGAAIAIQFRLLCNLMDGMVAVEGGKQTKNGELYNEFPDRIADLLILVGAGYALRDYPYAIELGWLAGSMAILTAYARALAGAAGAKQHFVGPMAKPHRMATMTVACIAGAIEVAVHGSIWVMFAGLCVCTLGSTVTVIRRLVIASRELEAA